MKDGVRIGVAVGLGYLLGRTRKMRLALMLVGVGVTGRVGKNPAGLVKQGVEVLGSSPEVKTLTDTVRGRLVEAGKAAAVTAVSSRVDTLTGKIEERTGALSSSPLGGQAERTDEDTDEDTDTDADEDEEADEEAQEEGDDERAAERRPQRPARPSHQRPPVRRTRRREQ